MMEQGKSFTLVPVVRPPQLGAWWPRWSPAHCTPQTHSLRHAVHAVLAFCVWLRERKQYEAAAKLERLRQIARNLGTHSGALQDAMADEFD